MCGIIGCVGQEEVGKFLIEGLKKLEYRGYDSAGICFLDEGKIERRRAVGHVKCLEDKVTDERIFGDVGIGHTRWATHGGVSEKNAHPHASMNGEIAIVHNGIIENYQELKEFLGEDYVFYSDTDTEVLANLIEHFYEDDLMIAIKKALKMVSGSYGLVVMHSAHPDTLICARMGSPMIVGLGEGENFVTSDVVSVLEYTRRVVYMDDGDLATLTREGVEFSHIDEGDLSKEAVEVDNDFVQATKGTYDSFLLKEIFEQPRAFENAIRGRYDIEKGKVRLGGINMSEEEMRRIDKIVLLGCGTTYICGTVGKKLFEKLAGIPVFVAYASEFRTGDFPLDSNTLVFAISQSGETADTLAALKIAKEKGAYVRGITNVVGSTISRETDGGSYIYAGPEISVASTKAYTNIVAVLTLYALQFGTLTGKTSSSEVKDYVLELLEIPDKMTEVLEKNVQIMKIAKELSAAKSMFFLGRGLNYPVVMEGSLKLKELAYIHSEAYAGGEMKHGPLALISEGFPVVAVATKDSCYEKICSNLEEARARGAKLFVVANKNDNKMLNYSEYVVEVPSVSEVLQPLINQIPLQLFAYHVASILERDIDRPRNLAKSVTVE